MARAKKVAEEVITPEVVDAKPAKKTKAVKETVASSDVKVSASTIKAFDVIRRPLITEKSMAKLEKQNKVTVEVLSTSNKTEVKLAFEAVYKVKVKSVNIVNVRSKFTRRGRYPGTISGFKKAVVTLVSGQALDLFKE
jgi:large subunit ribosomal protein L23